MATLTSDQLTKMRQLAAKKLTEVRWSKVQVNTGLQAVEDFYAASSIRPTVSLNSSVDVALLPFVLTSGERGILYDSYLAVAGDSVTRERV